MSGHDSFDSKPNSDAALSLLFSPPPEIRETNAVDENENEHTYTPDITSANDVDEHHLHQDSIIQLETFPVSASPPPIDTSTPSALAPGNNERVPISSGGTLAKPSLKSALRKSSLYTPISSPIPRSLYVPRQSRSWSAEETDGHASYVQTHAYPDVGGSGGSPYIPPIDRVPSPVIPPPHDTAWATHPQQDTFPSHVTSHARTGSNTHLSTMSGNASAYDTYPAHPSPKSDYHQRNRTTPYDNRQRSTGSSVSSNYAQIRNPETVPFPAPTSHFATRTPAQIYAGQQSLDSTSGPKLPRARASSVLTKASSRKSIASAYKARDPYRIQSVKKVGDVDDNVTFDNISISGSPVESRPGHGDIRQPYSHSSYPPSYISTHPTNSPLRLSQRLDNSDMYSGGTSASLRQSLSHPQMPIPNTWNAQQPHWSPSRSSNPLIPTPLSTPISTRQTLTGSESQTQSYYSPTLTSTSVDERMQDIKHAWVGVPQEHHPESPSRETQFPGMPLPSPEEQPYASNDSLVSIVSQTFNRRDAGFTPGSISVHSLSTALQSLSSERHDAIIDIIIEPLLPTEGTTHPTSSNFASRVFQWPFFKSKEPPNSQCTAQFEPPLVAQDSDPGYALSISFLSKTMSHQIYLHALLRLPSLYFSRVARIFEEANLTLPDLKKMALTTKSHSFELTKRYDGIAFEDGIVNVPPQFQILKATWESFIDSIMREWKTFNIIAVLLLS